MKRRIFSILSLGALLVGCSKDPVTPNAGVDLTSAVSISPMIQSRATDLNFEEGDQIGLSILMEGDNSIYADNSMMSYDGSTFTGDLVWYSDADLSSTLFAYYPYADGDSAPTSFTVLADQTAQGAYTASDFMMASKSGVTPSAESTPLTFQHSLSRIVVNIDNQSGETIESVIIGGSYSTALVDLASMSVVVDESSELVDITAPLWSDGSYKAVIVPQSVALSFTIIFAGGEEVSRTKGSVEFVSGSEYTAAITVVEGDLDVDLSGDADDWEEGGQIPDVSFEEFDGYFVYDGDTYQTITLSNGSTWMAEPLRYLPEGYTLSDDATVDSDVWYPYAIDYAQLVEDDKVSLSPTIDYLMVLTDEASIAERGYLYSFDAAIGAEITEENCYDFEGAQGVCPSGWHIPTRADYFALVGSSIAAVDESGTQVDETAVFYDSNYKSASVQNLIDGGFGFDFSGVRMQSTFTATPVYQRTMIQGSNSTVTDWYGNLALTYLMTSTCYKPVYSSSTGELSNIQNFAVMSTFTASGYPEGRLSLAAIGIKSGTSIRCVKDSE